MIWTAQAKSLIYSEITVISIVRFLIGKGLQYGKCEREIALISFLKSLIPIVISAQEISLMARVRAWENFPETYRAKEMQTQC